MSSPHLKSSDDYEIKKFLGAGSFGAVNQIKIKETNKVFALKEIHLRKIPNESDRAQALEEAKAEYSLLRNDLKNVVKSFGSNYDKGSQIFKFSMEYHSQNLNEYVENHVSVNNEVLSYQKFIPIFSDILTGFNHYYEIMNEKAPFLFFSKRKNIYVE